MDSPPSSETPTSDGGDMKSGAQRLRLVETPAEPPSRDEASPSAPELDSDASRALDYVISRFDAFIRRSARRRGLQGSDVDEVVQELRLRMWKSLGTAELIRRAKASYIYRAAISASIDIIRRRRARKVDAVSIDDYVEMMPDPHRSADARLEGQEIAAAVHRAVSLLAESRRAVVRMYLAGYDREEIADLLGWTEAKTRNLLYRGLGDLRKTLESWGIHASKEQSQ
jgi:RNA polymerase sigma-70 factor (ECF subfamily)